MSANWLKLIVRTYKLFLSWCLDWFIPIRVGQILFVTRSNVPVCGNLRVMLDAFSAMDGYRVYLFKEGGDIPALTLRTLQSQRIQIVQKFGFKALQIIFSSQLVVLSHSARDAYLTHRKRGRRVVNLWHGVALKQIENLMPLRGNWYSNWYRRSLIKRNSRIYDAMIASNSVDRLVNALAFGLPIHKVYPIGLPRFEYMKASYRWPADLQAQHDNLIRKLNGRKLVMYAPTFRDNGTTLSQLIPADALGLIKNFCGQQGVAFGIRPHPYRAHELVGLCDEVDVLDLSALTFPESAVLLRECQVLVVDYSSIWVDFLYQQRTLIAYAPDFEAYIRSDRGFVHSLEFLFPGRICRDWSTVLNHLRETLDSGLREVDFDAHSQAAHLLLPESYPPTEIIARCTELIAGEIQKKRGYIYEKNHHLRHF